ncbi:RNA 3'-terminal phosphate cyclase/enolpyruvate transferase [Kalaharituber pfeilii]|nr:RNA 3'-terminal phosphate cyclase/enolpyruvate transferase [Kalaharituber pfeilii]
MTTASVTPLPPPIRFTTHHHLRHRLVLATLVGRPLHISQIRSNSPKPGLTPYEFSFLRLLDSLTNGSLFEISVTGTALLYRPGLITGNNGKLLRHTLPEGCTRGVTYFLEPLCTLAPFSKAPFSVLLDGGVITAATEEDYSVDTFRTALLPLLANFDIGRNIEVRINKRSSGGKGSDGKFSPGAGEVHFTFGHQVRLPKTLHLVNPGRVKRIRGVAYVTGVSVGNNMRMIEAARGLLNHYINDILIHADSSAAHLVPTTYGSGSPNASNPSGAKKKVGVGYGLSLMAETSTSCIYSADVAALPGEAPEDVGLRAAQMLLHEISLGGCVGRVGMNLMMTMMGMGMEGDVGRVVIGREVINEDVVQGWRDMKTIMGGGEVVLREWEGVDGVAKGTGRARGKESWWGW